MSAFLPAERLGGGGAGSGSAGTDSVPGSTTPGPAEGPAGGSTAATAGERGPDRAHGQVCVFHEITGRKFWKIVFTHLEYSEIPVNI